MNSTSSWTRSLGGRGAPLLLAACALLFVSLQTLAADNPMPRPAELEHDVQFWIRVYSQVDTNSGFIHDEQNLAVVYDTLHFAPNSASHERQRIVDAARDHYRDALRRIAGATGALSPEDERIRALWGTEVASSRLLEATEHIRFQLGQSDRFREGLKRSGAWKAHVTETLADMGLPGELSGMAHDVFSLYPIAPPA